MGFTEIIIILLVSAGNVAVVKATNCWQTTVTVHYTVGPSVINVKQSDANTIMNQVLSHGKNQLSCSGLTLELRNVTIGTPGNLYSISGSFGVIYGNMNANQKQAAKTCLTKARLFDDIVLRPHFYISPLNGSHLADNAAFTNYQDTTCSINGINTTTPYPTTLLVVPTTGVQSRTPLPTTLPVVPTAAVKPAIINNGQKFLVNKGKNITLVCRGSSNSIPEEVTWKRKSDGFKESDLYSNITGNGKILNKYMTLRNVTIEDAGVYECSATWRDKTANGSVTLIVKVPVEVKLNVTLVKETYVEELKNKSSLKFKKLAEKFESELEKLYKDLTGFVKVIVTGFTNGSVKVSFKVIVVVKVEEPKQQSKPTVTKVNVTKRIIAKAKLNNGDLGGGLIIKEDSITTDSPPPSPRNVIVFEVKETVAHLRWTEPEDANIFSINNYIIKLKRHGFQFTWREKNTVEHFQLDSSIDELEDGTSYTVKVMARGDGGDGLDSAQEEFRTRESTGVNLIWLWIILALLLVIAVIAFGVYCFKKRAKPRERKSRNRSGIPGIENPDGPNSYEIEPKHDSFEMMPDKWEEIPRSRLVLGKTLGSGEFGMVKKGTLQLDSGDMTCAVKMIKHTAGEEERRDLLNELEILTEVGAHENLVNLIGACTREEPIFIVLEFAEGGSLINYLQSNVMMIADREQVSSLPDMEKIQIGLDIAKGMQHLAHVKCVHRDLAARNVLLTGNKRAKIADFGMSRDVYESEIYVKKSQGRLPIRWLAPEAIQLMFTTKGDIWSYGVVLWEIESGGKKPYGFLPMHGLIDYLNMGQRLPKPGRCRQEIYNVMLQCWQMDPNKRPSFDVICVNMEAFLQQAMNLGNCTTHSSIA